MSKNVGARSHASQVAADHRSRIAAGNAARLAAAGLALFLTFGFGGVAQASSAKADEKAQEKTQEKTQGRGLESSFGTSIAAGAVGSVVAGPAGQVAPSGPGAAEVIEISATSSETDVATLVVETTVDGVTTTTTTVTPNTEASQEELVASGAVTALAKVKGDNANEGKKPETAGNPTGNQSGNNPSSGSGNGSPDGGTYVETIVCHRDGVVIVIDDSGLNGHAADRYDTGHLEGVGECVDSDGDTVPDPVDADPLDPEVDDLTELEPEPECATGQVCDETEDETGDGGGAACEDGLDDAECDTQAPGGTGDKPGDKKDDGKKDDGKKDGGKKDDDKLDPVAPTVPGDKVEGPGTKGPGAWNDGAKTGGDSGGKKGGDNGAKAGGKKPEVLGEEAERPRGGKTPGKGGTTTTDVDKTPGGRQPVLPEVPQDDSTPGGEVLGEEGERPRKNRPAALVLPETGAASSMTAQAGAGLVMVLAGALTLRGRRRDS